MALGFVGLGAPGCGGEAHTEASAAGASSTTVGQGGAGGSDAGSGQGGGGGAGPEPSHGKPAGDFVSGGQVARSHQYTLVFTIGQSTQNQGPMKSPGYRIQGGVIGANGSLP